MPHPPPLQVETAGGSFRGDAVLVTVPLGVLKRRQLAFSPPLPQRKLDCIERLGFGVLNKVRAGRLLQQCSSQDQSS